MTTNRESVEADAAHADAMNDLARARAVPGPDPDYVAAGQQLAGVAGKFELEAGANLPKGARPIHRALTKHLSAASKAAELVDLDHAGIGNRPPGDRQWHRDQARAKGADHRASALAALEDALTAAEVLDAELLAAAIPPVPSDAADAKEELKMLLGSKVAKADVLALAREERFAGLLAGSWGAAYFRSQGNGDMHAAVRRSIAGKPGPQSAAARKAIAATRAAISHRMRAHGLDL